ncbi:MAG: hypothetical protein PWP65_1856 [Clostridia bacterium]|nr:hypothetical protein [Clostridia bacterium]
MPRGDRTGPWGLGPMTGRGAGFCAGFPVPGFMNPGWGFPFARWGFPFVGGRGYRRMYYATGLPGWLRWAGAALPFLWSAYSAFAPAFSSKKAAETEAEYLRQQASFLEEQLRDIKERLEELKREVKDEKDEE